MSGLISSNAAKLAWANGEQLQVAHLTQKEWETLTDNFMLSVFDDGSYVFRLTPRTIIINGIEVPAPFEPKVGEQYWFIADYVSSGYSNTQEGTGIHSSIGKWKSEDEIKQVVSALRSIFKVRN